MDIGSVRVKRHQRAARAFTLIELMVVAAIIAVLLVLTLPSVSSMMRSSQMAQADNLVRASLLSARANAMKHRVVAGVRFQGDGSILQVYATNMDEVFTLDTFRTLPTYQMKAMKGTEPAQFPGGYRVTMYRTGDMWNEDWFQSNWTHTWSSANDQAGCSGHWLGKEQWFVYPVVLFSPSGRLMFGRCSFSRETGKEWFPFMDLQGVVSGSETNPFRVATSDGGPINKTALVPSVVYEQQKTADYDSGGSSPGQRDYITGPALVSSLRLFNYDDMKTVIAEGSPPYTDSAAWDRIYKAICVDGAPCVIDLQTGMLIRRGVNREIKWN